MAVLAVAVVASALELPVADVADPLPLFSCKGQFPTTEVCCLLRGLGLGWLALAEGPCPLAAHDAWVLGLLSLTSVVSVYLVVDIGCWPCGC